MSVVIPTVTAYDLHEYRLQMERVVATGAKRVHIDLMDGVFAPTKSPDIDKLWVPPGMVCDIHLMYQHPFHQIRKVLALNPSLVILHAESSSKSLEDMLGALTQTRVSRGIALLQDTTVKESSELLKKAGHVLVFSGHLGCHGGVADMGLLEKVAEIKADYPDVEIGWDGGVNAGNITQIARSGVDVLNVGGAIHKSPDPKQAFMELSASGMIALG